MHKPQPNHYVSPVLDPRETPGFQSRLYPLTNGRAAPLFDATSKNERITLDFVNAYYAMNVRAEQLRQWRESASASENQDRERDYLRALETALRNRDELEDLYAPFGIIVEPIIRNGIAVDVQISFGNVDASGQKRLDRCRLSVYVPTATPPGTSLRELPHRFEGPDFAPR